jgi:hypothetical protein
MAKYPRIDSPCPLTKTEIGKFENGFCQHCERTVHNLDYMNNSERVEFIRQCKGKVCVSYTVKTATAAAIALTTVMSSTAVFATDALNKSEQNLPQNPIQTQVATPGKFNTDLELVEIMVGSVSNPKDADWDEHADGKDLPELPEINDAG